MNIFSQVQVVIFLMLAGALEAKAENYNTSLEYNTQEALIISTCQEWYSGQSYKSVLKMRSKLVGENGMCIDGYFYDSSISPINAMFGELNKKNKPILVVRSGGGSVDVAMDFAESIRKYNFTVIAFELCASSCANYILLSGTKKIVLDDTLLLFHGGVNIDSITDASEQLYEIFDSRSSDKVKVQIHDALIDIQKKVQRQEDFLEDLGISKHMFRWMNLYTHMSEAEQRSQCSKASNMILYAPEILAQFNYKLDVYSGPRTQLELNNVKDTLNIGEEICYWK